MSGFQTTILTQLAPGIEGDWASANPAASMLAGPGALVAGPLGVTVGRFAWADNGGVVRNIGGGGNGRIGFVQKDQPALITAWLAQSTMVLQGGQEIVLHQKADVWARFAAGANIGQKVYASLADGSCSAAAAGSPAGATSDASTIAAETNAFTAYIQNGTLRVTGGITGTIAPGTIFTGVSVPSGEQIEAQITPLLSGESAGGVGRYETSIADNVSIGSEAFTGSYGLMTVGGTIVGTFEVGAVLSGGGGAVGSVTGLGTGTGGAGASYVTPTQTVGSGAINASTNVETNWYVDSFAASGEVAMISTHG